MIRSSMSGETDRGTLESVGIAAEGFVIALTKVSSGTEASSAVKFRPPQRDPGEADVAAIHSKGGLHLAAVGWVCAPCFAGRWSGLPEELGGDDLVVLHPGRLLGLPGVVAVARRHQVQTLRRL